METKDGRTSFFDGGVLSYLGIVILGGLLIALTVGIATPWAITLTYGWRINHTVIEGRRLRFSGTGLGLFGNWIKWFLLTIITLGIYGFWVHIKLEDWKVRNTSFIN